MSSAARAIEAKIMTILHDSDCKVTARGVDGAGHKTVTFVKHGKETVFHFPSSPVANSRNNLNNYARLRRIIRDIPLPDPTPVISRLAPPEAVPAVRLPAMELPARVPTPPKPRITKHDIAKRYVALRSIEALANDVGQDIKHLINLMMSVGGQAADMARRERDRLRSTAKHVQKSDIDCLTGSTPTRQPSSYNRNVTIARRIYKEGIPAEIVALEQHMSVKHTKQIARDYYPMLDTSRYLDKRRRKGGRHERNAGAHTGGAD